FSYKPRRYRNFFDLFNHLRMNQWICAKKRVIGRANIAATHMRRHTAGLSNENHTSRIIPRLQTQFPKSVESARGHIREIERGRAITSHGLCITNEVNEVGDVVVIGII